MKAVEVTWVDATSQHGWYDKDEVRDYQSAVVRSVGYLFSKDKKAIKLCSGYDSEHRDYADIHVIPRDWVQNIREVK